MLGKRVVVTGGASGIGLATALSFGDRGARVGILDRDRKAVDRARADHQQLSAGIVADVSIHSEVEEGIGTLWDRLEGIDVLINNAGISARHPFLEISPETWNQVIAVNLSGVFYVAQAVIRRMVNENPEGESPLGVIINMASTNGLVGHPYYADYNASKAGVIQLTKTMALELAPRIRVNAVAPGYVWTSMQEAEYSPEMVERVNRRLPLQRHATVEEVAALMVFLASDQASYITGQVYVIDGGETAGGLASQPAAPNFRD